jgi:hypothetical protein
LRLTHPFSEVSNAVKLRSIEMLWPYGAGSTRVVDQMDVLVDLEDGSRWMSSFYDTHRFNQGVKGFRGLGPDQPFRYQERMIIVAEINEERVRLTVETLLESGEFSEAFEQVMPPGSDEDPGDEGADGDIQPA